MSLRWPLLTAVMASLGLLAAGGAQSPSADRAILRPNIVFIMAADLGCECLGCYGGTSYNTTDIDALAASGIRFRSCYATPLASPSRVELLTGRYGFRTGWTTSISRDPKKDEFLDPARETTLAQVLQRAGYATATAGTWQLCQFTKHPQHPQDCGFERSCCWAWSLGFDKAPRYWNPSVWEDGRLREDLHGEFGDDVFSAYLLDFIRAHQDRPFFIYYPTALVHEPFVVTPEAKNGPADHEVRKDNKETRRFAGMVAYLDRIVGRIVNALDALGLRERTLIIFTADDGTDRRITSLCAGMPVAGGKGTLTERGTHVPLIVSWKGKPAGRVCDDLIDFSDFFPTLAKLAAAPLQDGLILDGQSFAPQILGEPATPRDWVFSQAKDERYVRDRHWALYADGQLFDLVHDPGEKSPLALATDPAADQARQRLQAVLERLR